MHFSPMVVCILAFMANAVCFSATAQVSERPNVLFIAMDDLNDWIGCLGGHPQTITPNLDRILRNIRLNLAG